MTRAAILPAVAPEPRTTLLPPAPAAELHRRAIAAAEALRLLGVTLARDHEDARSAAHLLDVDQRHEEARAELQLLAEAFQAAGRPGLARMARQTIDDVREIILGKGLVDDLDCFAGWCEMRGREALDGGPDVAVPEAARDTEPEVQRG